MVIYSGELISKHILYVCSTTNTGQFLVCYVRDGESFSIDYEFTPGVCAVSSRVLHIYISPCWKQHAVYATRFLWLHWWSDWRHCWTMTAPPWAHRPQWTHIVTARTVEPWDQCTEFLAGSGAVDFQRPIIDARSSALSALSLYLISWRMCDDLFNKQLSYTVLLHQLRNQAISESLAASL